MDMHNVSLVLQAGLRICGGLGLTVIICGIIGLVCLRVR